MSKFQRAESRLVINDEAHTYHVNIPGSYNGTRLPSVTEILRPIVPESVSKYFTPESRERGRRVHQMVQFDIEGTLDVGALDDDLLSYYEGWMDFLTLTRFRPILCEQPIIHSAMYYAGRMDIFGVIDKTPALIDIKTGVVDLLLAGPQTAGYKSAAVYENLIPPTARRFVLDLKPGKGQLSEELTSKNDNSVFYHCLGVWKYNQLRAA